MTEPSVPEPLREALMQARKCIVSGVHIYGFGGRVLAQIDAALSAQQRAETPPDPKLAASLQTLVSTLARIKEKCRPGYMVSKFVVDWITESLAIAQAVHASVLATPPEVVEPLRASVLQEVWEDGWSTALQVHAHHGMSGWSVYRREESAKAANRFAALSHSAPETAPEPICAQCKGSGTMMGMSYGQGPDDHEIEVECNRCRGTGSASETRVD